MDPYLEDPVAWRDVHHALTTRIRDQLTPQLRPRYSARLEVRYVTDYADGSEIRVMYPDVDVVERVRAPQREAHDAPAPSSVATLTPPLTLTTFIPAQEKLVTIQIRDIRTKSLVTVIELLSPVNKRPASAGREEYLEKRGKILQTDVHLLEIDLLRAGERVPMIDPLPNGPYFVFLSRGHRRPQCEVWPIALRDPLPVLPVPLLAPDADVQLDLEEALQIVYDNAGYEDWIDYTQPPPDPLLAPDDAAWVETQLRTHHLR
jgi:hypothetical protein